MLKGVPVFALAAAVIFTVAACGSSTPTSNPSLDSLPTIQFVGNSTCPTSGASPYFTSNGKVKPAPVNSLPPVGQAVNEMPHTHVDQTVHVTYEHNPPTSGCHYNLGYGDAPIQTGVYDTPVADEYWVHNLEHGYVAVLYNCPTGCSDVVQKLITWRKGLPPDPAAAAQQPGVVNYAKVIVLPWPTMPVKFAAVSWDYYQGWNSFDLNAIQDFYANHVGHSPEGSMTG